MPRPAAMTRGPSSVPCSIALPSSMTIGPFAPRSRTVVTPARSAARALRKALSVASVSLCCTSAAKFASPSSVRWQWQLMSPGTANRPGARAISLRSFGADFGIFPRSPAQTSWGPSTTIATFSITRSPSKSPSTSKTVRIATQYRPAMPGALIERLRVRGFVPPDYDGGGLLNVAATVLDLLGARDDTDPPPLRALDPVLREGVRQVVVVLADGLGTGQLRALCAAGDTPFIASLLARAQARDQAQLIEATTIFPSTTAAAITTLNTARTPQEHGNIAYFIWLEEFAAVTQMLRWGPGVTRRGSFFDNQTIDPRDYVKVPSVHRRLRERGAMSYVVEPEIFRKEAMTRMHAAEANYAGYFLPSTMGVQVRELLETRPWGERPAYLYAYWSGIDATAHIYGPSSSACATEAALFDLDLSRALADRPAGDTLVLLTADHGHATTNPDKLIDLVGDEELRGMLRNPIAGEPRCAFLHTDAPAKVRAHLERRYPGAFFLFDRDEAIEAGLFGRGDAEVARRRIGEVCAMLTDDRAASIVRVDGQTFRHRGSHGGMTHDEMDIPILAWRV